MATNRYGGAALPRAPGDHVKITNLSAIDAYLEYRRVVGDADGGTLL